jgi:hypothetical protein
LLSWRTRLMSAIAIAFEQDDETKEILQATIAGR